MAGDNYGSCLGSRIFQGLGWGAFDVLVNSSIQDTYFVSKALGKQMVPPHDLTYS